MCRITRDKFQAVMQSRSGDHRIGAPDGLAGAIQIARDPPRQFGDGHVEWKYLF
jgi:hypothetical protein